MFLDLFISCKSLRRKCIDHLDFHCCNLIAASPFLVIGSSRCGGSADVSPRGDLPGFVRIRATFPTAGQIQAEQIGGLDVATVEAEIEVLNRT